MDTKGRLIPTSARQATVISVLMRSLGIGLCATLAFYCLLSLVAGRTGLLSHAELRERLASMEAKATELRDANFRLATEVRALTTDPSRLAREARKIGYLKPEETEILLVDLVSKEDVRSASDGAGIEDVLRVGEVAGLPDMLVKQVAVIVGLGFMLLVILARTAASRTGSDLPETISRDAHTEAERA